MLIDFETILKIKVYLLNIKCAFKRKHFYARSRLRWLCQYLLTVFRSIGRVLEHKPDYPGSDLCRKMSH